jgi:hypothetical protein
MTARFSPPHQKFQVNEGTRVKLLDLDQEPFRELLALMLSAYPDLETLKHWAARNPDRMAQSIMNISRCAGLITKEPTPSINIFNTVNLNGKSDSEILSMLAQQQQQLVDAGIQIPHLPAIRLDTILEQAEVVNA